MKRNLILQNLESQEHFNHGELQLQSYTQHNGQQDSQSAQFLQQFDSNMLQIKNSQQKSLQNIISQLQSSNGKRQQHQFEIQNQQQWQALSQDDDSFNIHMDYQEDDEAAKETPDMQQLKLNLMKIKQAFQQA